MQKMVPRSRIFYKMYFTNIALMVCFVGVLSFTCIRYSSRFIFHNIAKFNQTMINDRSEVLDDKIRQMDEAADMVVAGNDVIELIMTEPDQYFSPLSMRDIIDDLKKICSNYSLVDEILLVDYEREIVLTDRTRMSLVESGHQNGVGEEKLTFQEENGKISIRYRKNLKPVWSEKQVSIILTINRDAFEENLFIQNNEDFEEYLLMPDGTAFSPNGMVSLDMSQWKNMGEQGLQNTARESIAYKSQSDVSGITVVGIQNYAEIEENARQVTHMIIVTCISVIIVASLILYFFSLYVYRPLKRLSDHVSEMKGLKQGREKNEYDFIELVVNALHDEKQQMSEKYQEALPLVIQNTSSRLMTERYDGEAFARLLGILKREMNESQYAVLVMECREKEQLRRLEEGLLCLIHEDGMEAVYAETNTAQGAFLINTALSYGEFLACVRKWKRESGDIVSTWCVSSYFGNRDHVNLVFWETVKRLKQKFYTEENAIIYEPVKEEKGRNTVSDVKIEKNLLSLIRRGQKEEARNLLSEFTKELSDIQVEIQYTVFIYFKICSRLIQDLKDSDILISRSFDEKVIFLELFQAENIYELERITGEVLCVCADSIVGTEKIYSVNVKRTMEFIRDNYQSDLGLEEIAGKVYLSVGYLSNIFKEETGYTVMEYVTSFRMKKAEELLMMSPAIKIKDIAEKLGYQNVQSFIRYFKIYYGITPMEYRKKKQEKS